jgi:hypothetical protein
VLSEVIKSNDFYEQVLAAGFDFDESYFKEGKTSDEELKLWQKTVVPGVVSATQSIIEIKVYHPEKQQALEISSAVISVLKNKHSLYHNPEDKTQIMEIDKPIVSDKPAIPNVPLNIALGGIIGLLASFFYAYIFPEDKRSRNAGMSPDRYYAAEPLRMPARLEPRLHAGSHDRMNPRARMRTEININQRNEPDAPKRYIAEGEGGYMAENGEEYEDEYSPLPQAERRPDNRSGNVRGDMRNVL